MNKKILLAIDDTRHSRQAVLYAVRMAGQIPNLHFTLFHIQPHVSQFLIDEARASFEAYNALERLRRKNKADASRLLSRQRDDMIEMGMRPECIDFQTMPRSLGLAKDIIDFAQQKRYDAILVGRRRLSRLQEMFTDSLVRKLVNRSMVVPVWVVDGDVADPRILMAVDGSEDNLRAVDHVGFILSHSPGTSITLFHVLPRIEDYCISDYFDYSPEDLETAVRDGDRHSMIEFIVKAMEIFRKNGVSKKQIDSRQSHGQSNVGNAILEAAASGNYGTIVMGRKGADRSFFMGSVSQYVIDRMTDRAIWLVS